MEFQKIVYNINMHPIDFKITVDKEIQSFQKLLKYGDDAKMKVKNRNIQEVDRFLGFRLCIFKRQ
jgi:hypothetical protein